MSFSFICSLAGMERSRQQHTHNHSPVHSLYSLNRSLYEPHDHKKRASFGSTRNTFKIQTISQFYQHSRHPSVPIQKDMHIWEDSATSKTRDKSPMHRFSQQRRFRSFEEDRAMSTGDGNRLHLRSELDQGRTFACSKRKTYFPPQTNLQNPSPWTYRIKRWVEGEEGTEEGEGSGLRAKRNCYSSSVRGRTMTKEVRDNHKYYLDHARVHVGHHQRILLDHPGVGKYSIERPAGKGTPAYTMGQAFKQEINMYPAPNAYNNNKQPEKPSTRKGTFDRGRRLDLSKPLNLNPGPSNYTIPRYLEGKN